jgi:hypothetical protein
MQVLRELAYVLKKNSLQPISSSGQFLDKNSKMGYFFEGIAKGRYATDEEAALELYGDSSSASYRKMKSELLDRMLNALTHFDSRQAHFTDYQRAYYECYKEWSLVKILTGQNANTAAMSLAVKLLRQAEKYEFNLLAMDIASYLRIQYSLRESNDKKYREACALFDHYRTVYDAENQAEQVYTLLSVQAVNSRAKDEKTRELAARGHADIAPYLERFQSGKLHLYGRLIELALHNANRDYRRALDCCRANIAFFQAKPYQANAPIQIFLYEKLICHIQLRQFEEGRATADQCAGLMPEGSFNWFKYKELLLQLCFHSAHYEAANDLLGSITAHPRFAFLPENTQEAWRVYEAYGQFLAQIGLAPALPNSGKFKMGKFLNEIPIFSKDKSGANIIVMVIQYLFLLLDRKYAQVIDRAAVMSQYCYRYLSGRHTTRSFHFFKMLIQVPAGKFELDLVRKKAEKHLEQLSATPLDISNQAFEIEVIPYEILWETTLSLLATTKR